VFAELDAEDLPVEGEIPRELRGVFLRNGPSPIFEPTAGQSPVNAPGMIHAVYLDNGAAHYRNRWVQTKELLAEWQAGKQLRAASYPANAHVVIHAGHLLALGECGLPYRLDRELHTLGPEDFGGALPGGFSSHPKVDPETGEMIAVASNAAESRLDYLVLSSAGVLTKLISFDSPWPAKVHDIAVTRNYVVVFVCPYVLEWPQPRWRPGMGTAVALIPRRGTEHGIRWFEGQPFFHLHVMNAFEAEQYIELQLPWYPSWGVPEPGRAELHRLRINLENRTVLDERLDNCHCEFPRINDRFAMRENRYGYAAFRNSRPGERQEPGAFEALARYDFYTASRTVHTLCTGEFASEPVFVPARGATKEDEGYILVFVYSAAQNRSALHIYAARDLNGHALARILLPCRVPAGSHGSWVDFDRLPANPV
jgi:carotenoid cleavage dioxygenase-like enzyme